MHSGVNDLEQFDAVLLIGDAALRHTKRGLQGFEIIYDLAKEWYEWHKLPFVFAVWAVKKSLAQEEKNELNEIIAHALERGEADFEQVGTLHAKQIGLSPSESAEYLGGFNYRLGERELEALRTFESLLQQSRIPIPQGS